jgi:RecA/RadA recombinase
MSSIMDRLKKTSTVKASSIVSESQFFEAKDLTSTPVPALNIALSGDIDGGLAPGLTVVAGPSKHFKSNISLVMVAAYLEKYPDAIALLYDTEFGITPDYLANFDIDTDRVLHTPIEHAEQLKFDLMKQLEVMEKGDHVIIMIDSIGNLASKKELEDALDGKSVADMTRAKVLKGLFRMVTPYLNTRNIPMICVNHTYKEIGLFPKDIMSGGTGIYYSANQIFFMGRRQNKKGTEVQGYDFIINVDKSRFVKEKSRIPISVSWDSGVSTYSGLLDIAVISGHVIKPSNGWYQRVDTATGEILGVKVREKDTHTKEFWDPILEETDFKEFVKDGYQIGGKLATIEEFDVDEVA